MAVGIPTLDWIPEDPRKARLMAFNEVILHMDRIQRSADNLLIFCRAAGWTSHDIEITRVDMIAHLDEFRNGRVHQKHLDDAKKKRLWVYDNVIQRLKAHEARVAATAPAQ